MIFKQYYLGCLAHASYLIADEGSRVAAVVDPQRDVEHYIEDAGKQGIEIRHVLLTHQHADFIAGHLELRDRVGAAIYLGARAEAEYRFTPMKDGDTLRLGDEVTLQVLETPGHTPESVSILVFDAKAGMASDADQADRESSQPWAVLTGDTLFVGDVGRPDLRASLGWAAQDLVPGCFTTRCTASSWRSRTQPASTPRTEPGRCAGRRWVRRILPPSAFSGG